MARITITAADSGFFTSSATGGALAPNVFLKTGLNADGTAISFDGQAFESLESLRYSTQKINIETEMASIEGARLGQKADVTIHAVSFMRLEGGEMVEYGKLDLPEAITVEATYLSFGAADTPSWQFDLGTALGHYLNQLSFKFKGGEGDDHFNPHLEQLPYYGNGILFGRGGNDTLTGTAGSDFISGGTGDDVIHDNYGANQLRGGAGNDLISVGDGSHGSTLRGGAGDDRLISGAGHDTLLGGSGKDHLQGGRGDDQLIGNRGGDSLFGGDGKDTIDGGRGSDTLAGGAGEDVFVFRADEKGRDHIVDFEAGTDLIHISGLTFEDLNFSTAGNSTMIESDHMAGKIILEGYDAGILDYSDFIFA